MVLWIDICTFPQKFKIMRVAIIATALFFTGIAVHAQKLNIDLDKAEVSFVFVGDQTKGTVSGLNCEILFDPMDLSKASISGTIDASTLTTGNKARDKHLSASDFFHVEKYPVMKFESNEVVKEGKEYLMNGSLTIKDTTEPCSIRFTYADGVFLGKTAIDAKKYGVSPGKKEGTVQVTFSLPVL